MKSVREEIKDLEKSIPKIFTEEDIKFNRKMVDEERKLEQKGKLRKVNTRTTNCSFISEIINEFRRKWGIEQGE